MKCKKCHKEYLATAVKPRPQDKLLCPSCIDFLYKDLKRRKERKKD